MQTKNFNVYIQENQAVQDAYAMLTANIHVNSDKEPLKTITLTSYQTGVGKTTLAINLAITMADSGWRVLLIDTDIRRPVAAKRLNKNTVLGLTDCLAGKSELKDIICTTNVKKFDYISCGDNHPNPIGLLCSAKFKELLEEVKSQYDFVLFDTPALASVADATIVASKCDTSLIVAEMGNTKLATIKRAKELLEKANANILGVVLNKVKRRDYKKYFEAYNYFFDKKKFNDIKNSKVVETKLKLDTLKI